MTHIPNATVATVVTALTRATRVDTAIPRAVLDAAIATLIASNTPALRPDHPNPTSALRALARLERRAGLAMHTLAARWLAARHATLTIRDTIVIDDPEMAQTSAALLTAAGRTHAPSPAPRAACITLSSATTPNLNTVTIDGVPPNANLCLPHAAATSVAAAVARYEHGIATTEFVPLRYEIDHTHWTPQQQTTDPLTALDFDALMTPNSGDSLDSLFDGIMTDATAPVATAASPSTTAEEEAETAIVPLVLRGITFPDAPEHPSPLVEPRSLAYVKLPPPKYVPHVAARVLRDRLLSAPQMLALVYGGQAHAEMLPGHPTDPELPPPRRGFVLGYGTGTGKTRTGIAFIQDNQAKGRTRHIWIDDRASQIDRTFVPEYLLLGGRKDDLIVQADFAADDTLPARDGILVTTPALFRGDGADDRRRLEQLIDWAGPDFAGILFVNESDNYRYSIAYGDRVTSVQGKAFIDLQNALPDARVVYASATWNTELADVGYALRLGLFGKGTPFPDYKTLCDQLAPQGLGAMETLSRSLKALGLYIRAGLAPEGTELRRITRPLSDAEIREYDKLVALWKDIRVSLRLARDLCGLVHPDGDPAINVKGGPRSNALYWGASVRFFESVLTSYRMDAIIDDAQKRLDEGHAILVQFVSTLEAALNRAVERKISADDEGDGEDDAGDDDLADANARDIAIAFLERHFPVHRYVTTPAVTHTVTLARDAAGKPIEVAEAVAMRDRLIEQARAAEVPDGALNMLLDAFGTDAVAEITGRRRRLVAAPGEIPGPLARRVVEERTEADCDRDLKDFENDRKRILTFSDAGMVGSNYHASRRIKNRRRRHHYIAQLGFRADRAAQGMGRSGRTDQVVAPVITLVTTDLKAEHRYTSTVARRWSSMNAMTQGQRQDATALISEAHNMEGPYAQEAFLRFLRAVRAGAIAGMSIPFLEKELDLRLTNGDKLRHNVPVRRFLARLTTQTVERQHTLFEAFDKHLQAYVIELIEANAYDRGAEEITARKLIKIADTVVNTHPATGAETRYVQVLRHDDAPATRFDDAMTMAIAAGNPGFARHPTTGRIVATMTGPSHFDVGSGQVFAKVRLVGPTSAKILHPLEYSRQGWMPVHYEDARKLWDAELNAPRPAAESVLHLITGALLVVWDRLPKDDELVYRLVTDDGEPLIGRVVPENKLDEVLTNLAATNVTAPETIVEAATALDRPATVKLANGWSIVSRVNAAGHQIELHTDGTDPASVAQELATDGLIVTTDAVGPRFFLPIDGLERANVIERVTRYRPITAIS